MIMDGCDRLFSLLSSPTVPVGYILGSPGCVFFNFLFLQITFPFCQSHGLALTRCTGTFQPQELAVSCSSLCQAHRNGITRWLDVWPRRNMQRLRYWKFINSKHARHAGNGGTQYAANMPLNEETASDTAGRLLAALFQFQKFRNQKKVQ